MKRTYGIETPDAITQKVSTARRTADRKVVITLENGQVWRQVETVAFAIRVGDTAEIEAGMLGAYYLRRNGKGRSIRVTRIE